MTEAPTQANSTQLCEGLSIKNKISVLDLDKINLLFKKMAREEIGELEFSFLCIKILATPESNLEILDEVLNGEPEGENLSKIQKWSEIVSDIVIKYVETAKEAKKKPEVLNSSTQAL